MSPLFDTGKGTNEALPNSRSRSDRRLMSIWKQLAGQVWHRKHHSLSVFAKEIIPRRNHSILTRSSASLKNEHRPSGSRCLRMGCGPALLPWHLKAEQISHL